VKAKSAILPYLVWMIIFILLPLVIVIYYSFTTPDNTVSVSLENFKTIFTDTTMIKVFARSVWLGFLATLICLILAYPIAYSISRAKGKYQQTILMLILLPMWMNFLLRTYSLITLFENNGLINKFFGFLGLGPFKIINTPGAVVTGMVYNFLPFMILPIYSVMTKIDKSQLEAAQDLGANRLQVLWRVIMPLSLPGVVSGITMVFVPSVSTFIISKMLGGGSNVLIGDIIELHFIGVSYNPNIGSAISLVLMILMVISMAIMNKFSGEDMESIIV
jgi:ABC-type spermidine/putrescine transport system, permease component I